MRSSSLSVVALSLALASVFVQAAAPTVAWTASTPQESYPCGVQAAGFFEEGAFVVAASSAVTRVFSTAGNLTWFGPILTDAGVCPVISFLRDKEMKFTTLLVGYNTATTSVSAYAVATGIVQWTFAAGSAPIKIIDAGETIVLQGAMGVTVIGTADGKQVWANSLQSAPTWVVADPWILVVASANLVSGFHPMNGTALWSVSLPQLTSTVGLGRGLVAVQNGAVGSCPDMTYMILNATTGAAKLTGTIPKVCDWGTPLVLSFPPVAILAAETTFQAVDTDTGEVKWSVATKIYGDTATPLFDAFGSSQQHFAPKQQSKTVPTWPPHPHPHPPMDHSMEFILASNWGVDVSRVNITETTSNVVWTRTSNSEFSATTPSMIADKFKPSGIAFQTPTKAFVLDPNTGAISWSAACTATIAVSATSGIDRAAAGFDSGLAVFGCLGNLTAVQV